VFLRGESGQGSVEYAGALALVAIIFGGLFATDVPAKVKGTVGPAVCRILGGECGTAPAPSQPAAPPTADEPPAPVNFDLPFPVLPFPGSAEVSCTYATNSPGACQPGKGSGVSVAEEGKFSVERSPTTLDGEGCPTQSLGVKGTLELQTKIAGESPVVSGALTELLGESVGYSVTVPPDEAEALERGDRSVPNPVDPRTIRAGESVELSTEFYSGEKLSASYRALQVEMGFEEGRRLSAGVQRVSPSTVRISVGDRDFVRDALSVGIGNDSLGVALASGGELSEGKLRQVDVDISTQAGWDAYQSFLTSGRIPKEGTRGTSAPATSDVVDFKDQTGIKAKLGNLSIGGVLAESGANGVETHHPDGSVDTSVVAHFNDAGIAVTSHTDPGGQPEVTRYSLLLENVDDTMIDTYEHMTGKQLPHGDNGTVRFDFTPDDFETIQDQAFEQVMHEMEQSGNDVTESQLRDIMEEYPNGGDPYGVNSNFNDAYELAASKTPEQTLYNLYLGSGPGRNGNQGLQSMIDFMQGTTAARHDIHDFPGEHPDSLMPGLPVAPQCP
jgi:hypothetical protein